MVTEEQCRSAAVDTHLVRDACAVRWTGGRGPDRELVIVTGELCTFTVQRLEPFLAAWVHDTAATHLEVDLSACTFFGARGVSLLLALREQAVGAAKHLVLVNPTKAITRILRICDVEQIFEIEGKRPRRAE